jgi:hypothetical protein
MKTSTGYNERMALDFVREQGRECDVNMEICDIYVDYVAYNSNYLSIFWRDASGWHRNHRLEEFPEEFQVELLDHIERKEIRWERFCNCYDLSNSAKDEMKKKMIESIMEWLQFNPAQTLLNYRVKEGVIISLYLESGKAFVTVAGGYQQAEAEARPAYVIEINQLDLPSLIRLSRVVEIEY